MSGAVRVTVHRSRAFAYKVRSFKISVDGQVVAKVGDGSTAQFIVQPGRHTFRIELTAIEQKSAPLIVDCLPGELIVLNTEPRALGFALDLTLVSRSGAAQPVPVQPSAYVPAPAPRPPAASRPHVFISYSRFDAVYVSALAHHLAAAGLPVWFDAAIGGGSSFSKDIEQAIDACFAFVVVLTPAAVDSEWVRQELSRARRLNKRIWPLYLIPCAPPLEVEGIQSELVLGGVMPSARFMEDLTGLHRSVRR